jgi:hypothetical protein
MQFALLQHVQNINSHENFIECQPKGISVDLKHKLHVASLYGKAQLNFTVL